MLAKLQDLHDRGRVLFFICTNNFNSMDPAVKRGGRIDHVIGVGPPDLECRRTIIAQAVKELAKAPSWREPALLKEGLEELANETERFTRSEIQRAVRNLARRAPWGKIDQAKAAAADVAERLRDGLTIGTKDYDEFVETNNTFSQAVLEPIQI